MLPSDIDSNFLKDQIVSPLKESKVGMMQCTQETILEGGKSETKQHNEGPKYCSIKEDIAVNKHKHGHVFMQISSQQSATITGFENAAKNGMHQEQTQTISKQDNPLPQHIFNKINLNKVTPIIGVNICILIHMNKRVMQGYKRFYHRNKLCNIYAERLKLRVYLFPHIYQDSLQSRYWLASTLCKLHNGHSLKYFYCLI